MVQRSPEPAVWFPTISGGTGADVFTKRLVAALGRASIRSEIAWLPHRSEFAPWSVRTPIAPSWANIIHINSWLPKRFFERSGLPIVTTCHGCVHDPALVPYKSPLQSLYHRFWVKHLERQSYHASSAITAVSRYTATHLRNSFGDVAVEVIPNGLPHDAFLEEVGTVPHFPFRLLYLGKWSRRKGADLLPKIMSRLGSAFELHYTGDPPANTVLPPNMRSLGWTTDPAILRRWLSATDALLFPSRMEGMPLSVLEAMACGLPVIAAKVSSLPEIVDDGITGILCERDDTDAFVAACRTLAESPALWRTIGRAARAQAEKFFMEEIMLKEYINIYRMVLNRSMAN